MYLTWRDVDKAGDDLDPATDVLALGKLVTTLLRHVNTHRTRMVSVSEHDHQK